MSDGTYRGRWMDEVCGSPRVSPEVKVLLLTMARWMDEAGHVSVPREQLAALLRCAPRNITAKQKAARDAGLLLQVKAGRRGGAGEFEATIPDTRHPVRVTTVITLTPGKGDDGHHPNSPVGGRQSSPKLVNRVTTTNTLSGEERVTTAVTLTAGKGDDSHHPKNGAPYKDPARALTTADRSDTPADVIDHGDEAMVVSLFDEKTTTGKTQTPARKRASKSAAEDPAFAEFWDAYPKRVAKGAARKAWDKAIKAGADPKAITLAARRYATDPRRSADDIRYTAHPATWLNAERWADEDEPPPRPSALVPTNGRPLTGTDAKVAGWLAAADRLEAQENQR